MKAIGCLLVGMVAGCAQEKAIIDPMTLGEPVGPVTLIREAKGSAAGGYDLFGPARPTPLNGGVWVLDQRNDQLVRFDSTLSRAHAVSREGEGPGELEFAYDLAVDADRLIVADMGNGRFSVFDTTGAFQSIIPIPKSPAFVVALGGQLVATVGSGTDYFYRVDAHGQLQPHARMPDAIRRLAASDPAVYLPAGPYVAAADDRMFVLDQSVLAIAQFDANGSLETVRMLPDPYRTRLLERRSKMRAGFGARASSVIDMPAAKRIWLDRDGRLLVLFPLPDAWGLLIDTKTWTARPLLLPEDRRLHDILFAASDASLDGDRLYLTSRDQLYQLAAEGWR